LPRICPFADDLDPESSRCPRGEGVADNPLFAAVEVADGSAVRPPQWVVLAGLVGVPWQDLAIEPSPSARLLYRDNDPESPDGERLQWDWLIGERHPASGIPAPSDPLMIESIEARAGTNPATGENLAQPGEGYLANSINGHEW